MSASINTRESSISMAYLKRAAGLISGSAKGYIKDVMPTTTSTISEAKTTITEVKTTLKSTTQQQVLPILKQLKIQPSFKNISNWFLEKEEEFGGEDDGSHLSFDIDTDNTAEIAEEQISEIQQNANQVSRAVVESSGKLAEAQMTATANLISVAEKQMSVIAAGFDKTNETLNKILEVLTKNTSALIESTIAGAQRSENDRMIASGKFSLSGYKNILKENAKKSPELSMITSFLPMLLNPDQMKDMMSSSSILGGLLDFGINKGMNKFAPNFKKNAKALDDAISDTLISSLVRLGETRDYGIKGSLAKLFGIDASKKEADTSRSDLELKAVPFDSVTKEAITNAIPGYLRKILVAVGGDDVIYDYTSRSFRTKKAIHNEIQRTVASTGTLSSASNNVRKELGDGKMANMLYDLMMVDLGSRIDRGEYRDIIESFKNVSSAEKYINARFAGLNLSRNDKKEVKKLAERLSRAVSGMGGIDIGNQVARTNINRNYRSQQLADRYNDFGMDISDYEDGDHKDRSAIQEYYGVSEKPAKSKNKNTATIKAEPSSSREGLTGINYANVALFEIFRRLNEGINVFQVGSNSSQKSRFRRFDEKILPKPDGHKPKSIPKEEEGSVFSGGSSYYDNNPLHNDEVEDEEGLSKGQKFARWGKKRGTALAQAMFNGSPDQVREAFGDIFRDATGAGKNLFNKGVTKVNDKFGNVGGYVKHKVFGTGYSYTDEDGKEVRIKEGKGALGFITDEFKGMFENAKKSSSDWIKTTMSFFDKPDSDDNEEPGIVSKRKKLLGASIGAFAGAGLLGGPLGIIMGGLAGNALSSKKIGKKINKLLFGYDDEGENATGKATGIISKAADAVISPVKFQLSKTITFAGATLQKHVFGPMSDLGRSITDRIHNHVDSIFDKVKHLAGKVFGKVFGFIGKGAAKLATGIATVGHKIGTTVVGKATRGVMSVAGNFIGGSQRVAARLIAGNRSFHKLKKGESYALLDGDRYLDPTDRNTVRVLHRRSEVPGHKVEWIAEFESYGIWLNGDNKNELMPATKDYNKRVRNKRNADINKNLKESGFYGKGGVLGFLGGDYLEWRKKDRLKGKERRTGLKNALREEKMSPEEIAAANAAEQEKNRKQQEELAEKQQETTQAISDNVENIVDLLEDEHPQGGKKKRRKNKKGKDSQNKATNPETTTTIDDSDDSGFGNAVVGAIADISSRDGMDQTETKTSLDALDEAAKDKPDKKKLSSLFSNIIKHNKATGETTEEKKENSFISKLLGGLGSGLLKYWPLVLGAFTLLSDKFREGLFSLGSYLLDKLPDAFDFLKKTAKEANEYGEASTQGAEVTKDQVTGETEKIVSAEQQNENYNEGYLKTSAKQAWTAPFSIFKNSLMSIGENITANTFKHLTSGGVKTALFGRSAKKFITSIGSSTAAKAIGFGNSFSTSSSKNIFGKVWDGLKGFKRGTSELQDAAILEGATKKTLFGRTRAKVDPLSGTTKLDAANNIMSVYDDIWKSTSGKVGSFAMGFAYDAGFSTGSRYKEMKSHRNILGSYYDGTSAGGYRSIEGGATESVVQFATGAAIVAGCKFGAAAIVAATGVASIPVIGLAVIVCAVAGGILGYLTHWVIGNIKEGNNEKLSVNTNATKMKHVLEEKIDYTQIDPAYIYNGKDSDRTLGLNAGTFIRNPEISFGYFISKLTNEYNKAGVKTCAEHIGAEVLLYEFICNLAYQGVPWACYVAGSSKDVEASTNHANNDIWPDYSTNGEGGFIFKHDTIQVTQKNAKDNINVIMEDIQRSMKERGYEDYIWDLKDLEDAYNAGKEVYDTLKSRGILNNKGEVVTKKLKGSYNGGSNNDGWKILCELGKSKGIYFVIKCIVFIDAHIDVSNNERWAEINKDNINSLFYDINPDVSPSEIIPTVNNTNDDSSKESGFSDHDSSTAEINSSIVSANYSDLTDYVSNNALSTKDVEGINQQIKYITAGWAFSHPNTVNNWLEKKGQNFYKQFEFTKLDIKDKKIVNWKDLGSANKEAYLNKLRDASVAFAEEYGDIFGLADKINWSGFTKSDIYTKKDGVFGWFGSSMKDKYGASIILKNDVSTGNSVGNYITDMYNDYFATSEVPTPDEVHDMLFGSPLHGDALENSSSKEYNDGPKRSSLFGRIGKNIWFYPSYDFTSVAGPSSFGSTDPYSNNQDSYISSMNLDDPKLPNDINVGGDDSISTTEDNTTGSSNTTSINEGGNPFGNRPFRVTSNYGWRDLDSDGKMDNFHKGVDIVPTDGGGAPDILSRFNGKISKIVRNIPDSHTGLGTTTDKGGNMVWIDTDSGLRIKNMHLKAGSIPSSIREGSRVSIGTRLGTMGSTGNSSGPHLHYQIDTKPGDDNSHINPISSINKQGIDYSSHQDPTTGSESSLFDSWYNNYYNNGSNDESTSDENTNGGKLQSFINLLTSIGQGFIGAIAGIFGGGKSSGDNSGSSYGEVSYTNGTSTYNVSGTGAALAASMLDENIDIELLTNEQVNAYKWGPQRATVIDLLTGITYDIFWGGCPGGTHTDYSTYTADDTEKKIAACTQGGGKFPSWDPRPCILRIQDHQVAVGTHNRNHGSVIGGNPGPRCPDMPNSKTGSDWPDGGHFCMYYSNSVSNAYGLSPNAKAHQVACQEAYELAKDLIKMKLEGTFNNTTINGPENGVLGNGDTLMFPDEYGVMETYEKEMIKDNATHGWSSSSRQGVLRKDAIARGKIKPTNSFGLKRVATVDGRMLIATKENIGGKLPVKVGDHLDVKFKDGSVWNAMVGDIKGSDAPHPWGHQNGKCSTEIIYWDYDSNSGNQHKKVESITKTGGKYILSNGNPIGGDNISIPNYNASANYAPSARFRVRSTGTRTNANFSTKNIESFTYHPSSGSLSSNIPTTESSNISNEEIVRLLNVAIGELQQITGNTGESADLLGSLNEKDFVDAELRDSLSSLGKSRNTTQSTSVPTSRNVSRVLSIATP